MKEFTCEQCNSKFMEYPSNRTKKHIYCSKECVDKSKECLIPWNKGMKGFMSGEKNGEWKGSNVGYTALHDWVKRYLGPAMGCQACGDTKKSEWANVSHEYKRELSDWVNLCRACHAIYDSGENWGKARKVWFASGNNYLERRLSA